MDNLSGDMVLLSYELLKVLFELNPPPNELKCYIEQNRLSNETTILHVVHYCLTTINREKAKEYLLSFWPLSSYKCRANYRVGVMRFFKWLEKEWPGENFEFTPSVLVYPKSKNFHRFISKLILFTVKFQAIKENIMIDSIDAESTSTRCELSTVLLNAQHKLKVARNSFLETKKKLDESYIIKNDSYVEMRKQTLTMNNNLLTDLIKTCPDKYKDRLASDDNETWKSAIFEWANEFDELHEKYEEKLIKLETIVAVLGDLIDIKNNFRDECMILDANELLSIPEHNAKLECSNSFQISSFHKSKLSLNDFIKTFKKRMEGISQIVDDLPTQIITPEEMEKDLAVVDNADDYFANNVENLSSLKLRLEMDCRDLMLKVKEKDEDLQPRNLSSFFDSPLMRLNENTSSSPVFSSPGLAGVQLLEDLKKNLFSKIRNEPDWDTPEILVENTPVSRKTSGIPRYVQLDKKPASIVSKVRPPPNFSFQNKENWNRTSKDRKAQVLSSTMLSNISHKNLEESPDQALSPIHSGPGCSQDHSILSYDGSEDLNVPSCSSQPDQSSSKRNPRPSIDNIIEKYMSLRSRIKDGDK